MGRFSLDQSVSRGIAFSFILILACAVAWFSVDVGQEMVRNAEESGPFNIDKRLDAKNVTSVTSLPKAK